MTLKVSHGIFLFLLALLSAKAWAEAPEIPFPERPSDVPEKIYGVEQENWKTFGVSCSSLSDAISRNKNGNDRWSKSFGEIPAKTHWISCLESIRRVKSALAQWRDLKPEVEGIRDTIAEKHNKEFPLIPLATAIGKHVHGDAKLSRNHLYTINVFRPRYKVIQKLPDGGGLFIDTRGKFPPVYFRPRDGQEIREGVPINQVASYYSFLGTTTYTNRNGFKREAFVFGGYEDKEFRSKYSEAIKAHQWIRGDVNTSGM